MADSMPLRAMPHVAMHSTVGLPPLLLVEVLASPLAGHRVDRMVLLAPVLVLPLAGHRAPRQNPDFLGLHMSRLGVTIRTMRRR